MSLTKVSYAMINGAPANILDYGASESSSDNTASIQKALDENSCVYIPAGTYIVSNINLETGQTLFGDGQKSVLLAKSGATNSVISIAGTDFNANKIENVTVQNLKIDGNSQTVNGFSIENAYRVALNNIYVTDCVNALDVERCELVDTTECSFTGNSGYGVRTQRVSDSFLNSWINFYGCVINGNTLGGMYFTDTASPVISSTKILGNFDFGVQADVSAGKIGNVLCTAFVMESCDIDSNVNAGIRLYTQYNFAITDTWVSGGRTITQTSLNPAGQAIYLNNCQFGNITNAQLFNNGGVGIAIEGTSQNITINGGNIVANGNSYGIYANASDCISVIGSTVYPNNFASSFTQDKGIGILAGNYHTVVGCSSINHSTYNYNVVGNKSKTSLNVDPAGEVFNTANNYQFHVLGTNKMTIDNNGYKYLFLPTSSAGLPTGVLWNDGGTVKVA